MAGSKRFASDFQRIDAVKPSDKLLIQDSEDGVVKFAFPNQVTAVNGWKVVESIEDLPLNPARKDIGYIVGNNIYFWVGTDGDTLDGKYQKANIFKGEDGATPYIHFAYANSADGYNDFSITESGNRKYLGIYVDDVAEGSTDPTRYKWSRIQGEQGAPSYVHIAYANSADGVEGFSLTESEGRTYLGIYVDSTKGALDDPAAYKWMHTQGIQGEQGERGEQGESGVTYYEVATTWQELVNMRDNGELVAGLRYRITDYVTTTSQYETASAGHPFDLIVTAISESVLSEEASAIWSERDTEGYFRYKPLNAWRVWYCLDNNSIRFGWADFDGTGVIYRLIDENGNDCPFDMYNIMYVPDVAPADAEAQAVSGTYFFEYGSDNALMGTEFIIQRNKIETHGKTIPLVFFYCKGNYGRIIGNTAKDCNFVTFLGAQLLYNTYEYITNANINGSANKSVFSNLNNPGINIKGTFYGKMFDIQDNDVNISGSGKYTFVTTDADNEVLIYTVEDTLGGGGGITVVTETNTDVTLQPNTLTKWTDPINALTLTFAPAAEGQVSIYGVEFNTMEGLTIDDGGNIYYPTAGVGESFTAKPFSSNVIWFVNGIAYVTEKQQALGDVIVLKATYQRRPTDSDTTINLLGADAEISGVLQMFVNGVPQDASKTIEVDHYDLVTVLFVMTPDGIKNGMFYNTYRGVELKTLYGRPRLVGNAVGNLFRYSSFALPDVKYWDTSEVTIAITAFQDSYCENVDVSGWDLSKATAIAGMFRDMDYAKVLNIEGCDFSGVIGNTVNVEISYFCGYSSFEEVQAMGAKFSNLINQQYMFANMQNLKVLDLSEVDFSNLQNAGTMMRDNSQMERVYLPDMPNLRSCAQMFYNCSALTEVHMGAIGTITSASSMFENITTEGTLYYDGNYDYSKIIAALPATWVAIDTNNNDNIE